MSTKEDYEFAAKAAGMKLIFDDDYHCGLRPANWNPEGDDGDSRRLEVRLGIFVKRRDDMPYVIEARYVEGGIHHHCDEYDNGDPYAATRLAVFRAAVEIGRSMK